MELWVYSEFEWRPYQNVLFQEGKVAAWNLSSNVKRELDQSAPDELLVVLERAASTDSLAASPPTQ
jgi:hypothetical protein